MSSTMGETGAGVKYKGSSELVLIKIFNHHSDLSILVYEAVYLPLK